MDSVLDRIGNDSDTSETDQPRPTKVKSISLKAVVEAIDNSPIKFRSDARENASIAKKLEFSLAKDSISEDDIKQMPLLIPAPAYSPDTPDRKIVKREKFWEYEEIDDKPKEKRKKKLPGELARLQDTDEYLEAAGAIKSDSTSSERSKRPPRRAAILARETVNFLHGNVENGLELRGTRKALEKEREETYKQNSNEDDSDDNEESNVKDILSNSDLFDADEFPQVPSLVEPNETTLRLPDRKRKERSTEENRKKSKIVKSDKPRANRDVLYDIYSPHELSCFKIPKKKITEKTKRVDGSEGEPVAKLDIYSRTRRNQESQKSTDEGKKSTEFKEYKDKTNPRDKKDPKFSKESSKETKNGVKKPTSESSNRLPDFAKKEKSRVEKIDNGNLGDQEKWRKRVDDVKELFNNWVKKLPHHQTAV